VPRIQEPRQPAKERNSHEPFRLTPEDENDFRSKTKAKGKVQKAKVADAPLRGAALCPARGPGTLKNTPSLDFCLLHFAFCLGFALPVAVALPLAFSRQVTQAAHGCLPARGEV
jgi:hypothetical protein